MDRFKAPKGAITINVPQHQPQPPININVPNTGTTGSPFVNWTGGNNQPVQVGINNNFVPNIPNINVPNIPKHISNTPTPPPDTSPLANITENVVELRNVPNAVSTLVQHAIQQNGTGKGVDAIKNVQNFNLSYDLIQDNDAAALNDGLYGYTIKTQTFNLGNNNIGATGIDHLVKGSIGMGYVLSGGKDINQSMQGIFTLSTTSIVHLNLCNNNIGDVGAEIICHALVNGRMKNTKAIDVSGNNIYESGKASFAKALEVVEQNIAIVTDKVASVSKQAFQSTIKGMLYIAKSNGISTKEVLTTNETIEHCKKGVGNVAGNVSWGIIKCFTNADTPIAVYEMDLQTLIIKVVGGIINPLKKPAQFMCITEQTIFSVVDEEFANCLTGLDSGLSNE